MWLLPQIRSWSSKNSIFGTQFLNIAMEPIQIKSCLLPDACSVCIRYSFGYFLIIHARKRSPCPFGWFTVRLNSFWSARITCAKSGLTRRKMLISSRLSSRYVVINVDTALAAPLNQTQRRCWTQSTSWTILSCFSINLTRILNVFRVSYKCPTIP